MREAGGHCGTLGTHHRSREVLHSLIQREVWTIPGKRREGRGGEGRGGEGGKIGECREGGEGASVIDRKYTRR